MALPELAAAEITIQDDVGTRCPGPAAWVRSVASGAAASDDGVARHGEIGPRLAGTLVLDLSTMVAGPACSRTLAEYGAQAIHVESPRPHHGPRLTCWYGAEVNQGKRSVLLDITDPAGRAVLDRLIAAADVIVHNFSPAACRKLGLDDAPLHRTNPRAVIVRVGAYAGPLAGPLDDRRGYDPVLQAASGIMRRYGGDHPVHHGIASCVDYLTGCLAAWAAALGLLARAQGSQQVAVATSLAQAATLIQLPFLAGGANGAPTGQWAWGASALERIYRARDGWIFLAAPLGARKAVAAALGVTLTAAACDDRALARQLARAIRRRRLSSLAAAPRHGGVALVPIRSLPVIGAVLAEEGLPAPCSPVADGATLRFAAQPGPDGVTVRTLIPAYARARNAPLLHLAPAPKPGTDTVAVLAELGFAAETADLLRRGIAAGALHPRLLPE
jgi:crotonobetainyl-CoA:carnitine CoA-transferase CaiB-like acyl-CoA transferase